jgi:hypothetical protein
VSSNFSWSRVRRWVLGSKYLLVTLSIMSFLAVLPYTFNQYVFLGRIVLSLWIALILITLSFSVYRIKVGGKIALLLIIISLIFVALNSYIGTYAIELTNRISSSITLAFVTMIIFLDLAADNVKTFVTSDYIWGGIATYLLIGFTFASLFHLIELIAPGSFSSMASSEVIGFPLFIYFSYYVLTTVGGVLTPITLQAQSIVMIEPIIGTLYIAILIARLVNLVTSRKE